VSGDGSHPRLGQIVDARSCPEGAGWPSNGTPKRGAQMLAMCATPGQLDYFAFLVFEQLGEQPTLRKSQR